MAMYEPSAQLLLELRASVQEALAARRPLLHHLNSDTSWLLQIPRPTSGNGGRFYYNILIDPWLQGGQSDLASWFSQQWHAEPSAIPSVKALEELIRESEKLASDVEGRGRKRRKGEAVASEGVEDDGEDESETDSYIDAVAVSHEFTDHCHKETLLEVHPDVPVFAVHEAAKLINSWHHFRMVIPVDVFGATGTSDWRGTSQWPLPEWLGISRLLQADDVLNYHAALLITFNNRRHTTHDTPSTIQDQTSTATRKRKHHPTIEPNEDDEAAEAIVYTPHGIHSGDLDLIPAASPPITTLAFLHGLHNVRVGTASGRTALQSNLGAHNGLKAQRILNAKYWIGTHDEVKRGGGLVAWFLQRDVITLKEALDQERELQRKEKGDHPDGEVNKTLDAFEGTNWLDLGNGESWVLR